MILFYMFDTFYLSSVFPSVTFIKYVSSYRKMKREPMNNASNKHEYRHKRSKIGPSYLLSENGDLSFLFFSKRYLVENFEGKLQKTSSVSLISEELP